MIDKILLEIKKTNPDMDRATLIKRLRESWSSAACLAMIEMNGKKNA